MKIENIRLLLYRLIDEWEHETVEFKRGGAGFSIDDIGKYFSALANEANLREMPCGYLIFGVDNKSKCIVGTDFRPGSAARLQSIKHEIGQNTSTGTTFTEVYDLLVSGIRVIIFKIPAAPKGQVVAFKGFWYARHGESIVPLDLKKLDEIRGQFAGLPDWSSKIVSGATIHDLDSEALRVAREKFSDHSNVANKHSIESMDTPELLRKLQLIDKTGALTNAAILLLGKPESATFLSPYPAQISWILKDDTQSYEHFGLPFLLTSTKAANMIRITKTKLLPQNSLIAKEIPKYEYRSILEAIHNCIAHQDYTANARITIDEYRDRLVFTNAGDFFEGQPIDYVLANKSPKYYRNPLLVKAMVNLNMIDTIGFGVREIYKRQIENCLPLPDYCLSELDAVSLTIYAMPLNELYTQILLGDKNLEIQEVLALDAIQKHQGVAIQSMKSIKTLRNKGYIKGSGTMLKLSLNGVHDFDENIKIEQNILDIIAKLSKISDGASRKQIDIAVWTLLGSYSDDSQKSKKIANILAKLKRKGLIENIGNTKAAIWRVRN